MSVANSNASGSLFPPSDFEAPVSFIGVVAPVGFTLGRIVFDGSSFTYVGATSPGNVAQSIEYIAWGGNLMQFGDVGAGGGGAGLGVQEIDFAVANGGNFKLLSGNGGPGINILATISNAGFAIGNIPLSVDGNCDAQGFSITGQVVVDSNSLTNPNSGQQIIDFGSNIYKDFAGNRILNQQGAAVANATDAASVIARLNDLLARLRSSTGHGLIAG